MDPAPRDRLDRIETRLRHVTILLGALLALLIGQLLLPVVLLAPLQVTLFLALVVLIVFVANRTSDAVELSLRH